MKYNSILNNHMFAVLISGKKSGGKLTADELDKILLVMREQIIHVSFVNFALHPHFLNQRQITTESAPQFTK